MKDMTFHPCFLDAALWSAKGMGNGLHNAEVCKTKHENKKPL